MVGGRTHAARAAAPTIRTWLSRRSNSTSASPSAARTISVGRQCGQSSYTGRCCRRHLSSAPTSPTPCRWPTAPGSITGRWARSTGTCLARCGRLAAGHRHRQLCVGSRAGRSLALHARDNTAPRRRPARAVILMRLGTVVVRTRHSAVTTRTLIRCQFAPLSHRH
jgi:hypothetical protein